MTVDPDTGTTSDHFFVHFQLPVSLTGNKESLSEIKESREFNKLDVDGFKQDIGASPLNSASFDSLEDALELYTNVLECLLSINMLLLSLSGLRRTLPLGGTILVNKHVLKKERLNGFSKRT